jgi:hypothetical protein
MSGYSQLFIRFFSFITYFCQLFFEQRTTEGKLQIQNHSFSVGGIVVSIAAFQNHSFSAIFYITFKKTLFFEHA